eukprot:11226423-Lingulodinium_polyedra.AAC.1
MAGLPGLGKVATAATCQNEAARPQPNIFHWTDQMRLAVSRGHSACRSGGMPSTPPPLRRFAVALARSTTWNGTACS